MRAAGTWRAANSENDLCRDLVHRGVDAAGFDSKEFANCQNIMMRGTAEELAARAKSGELRVATIGTGDLFYTPSACVFSYKTGAADVIGFRFGVMAYEFRPRLERVLQRCGPQLPSTITDAFSHAKNELNRPVYNTQKQLRDSAVEAECRGDDDEENKVEVAGGAAPEMSGPQPLPDEAIFVAGAGVETKAQSAQAL